MCVARFSCFLALNARFVLFRWTAAVRPRDWVHHEQLLPGPSGVSESFQDLTTPTNSSGKRRMDLEQSATGQQRPAKAVGRKVADQLHEFNFPYPPYEIQLDLMKAAYETYDKSKFALLESPTGTGKSLSLICSSLTWLKDHRERRKQNLVTKREDLQDKIEDLKSEEETSGDWLKIQTKRQDFTRELADINKELERISKFERINEARRHAKLHGIPLEHYSAFIDGRNSEIKPIDLNETQLNDNNLLKSSQESRQSDVQEDDGDMEKKAKAPPEEDHIRPKIFYASRTHSQLSQFVNEVKKTEFADFDVGPTVRVTSLASRANLCVNSEVIKLKDSNAINERCLELQKETKAEKRCPYVKSKHIKMLKDDLLSSVQDIEDLVGRGRALCACPYYATRMAVPEAELVVLPYNNLLHRETRHASSLDLRDSVVIIDEAHNILETICSIHSAAITGLQLIGSHTIFSRYYQRFHAKMSPRNAAIVKNIVQCLTVLIRYLNNPKKHLQDYDCPKSVDLDDEENQISLMFTSETNNQAINGEDKICKIASKRDELILDVVKFVGASDIERFNVFKIIDYLNRSQLARKLLGLFRQDDSLNLDLELHGLDAKSTEDSLPQEADFPKRKKLKTSKGPVGLNSSKLVSARKWELTKLDFLRKSNPALTKQEATLNSYPIYVLVEFLKSLTNSVDDGKIITDYTESDILQSSLKFILLNPSSQFKQMVEEARSIILAGGTMQPFDEFLDLLFGPLKIEKNRLTTFSCGHVITPDHLYVASLIHGPTGKPLELSYKTRSSFETIDEIGRAIMNIAYIVPGGIVCFLPSYDYEQACFKRWTQNGIITKIEVRSKHVFREPRQATQSKAIFEEYARTIEKGKGAGRGALLFCVVGGKMSEGINFNDDLGRCIVMIGLPYANIKSGELQQKMSYYDRACKKSSPSSVSPGQQYYENLCVKGINQSIGRAIRHRNDYAAIILLDRRYSMKSSIKSGLSGWMRKSHFEYERFGPMFSELKAFFNEIESKKS